MLESTSDFLRKTAADLMSSDPITVNANETLQAAAEMLTEHRLSGLPVVDDEGRCVGVLSATDFVQWMGRNSPESPLVADPFYRIEKPTRVPGDPVSQWMTADPVTVAGDRRVSEVARMMLDAHIHRVIVVDHQQRPMGIVTTTDILAAVAYLSERDA